MTKGETEGTFDRETKRMVRYTTAWGTIYVPKEELPEPFPQKVKVSVTPIAQ